MLSCRGCGRILGAVALPMFPGGRGGPPAKAPRLCCCVCNHTEYVHVQVDRARACWWEPPLPNALVQCMYA